MLLLTTLIAAAAASALLSLFDSEAEEQGEEVGFDGNEGTFPQETIDQQPDLLEQLYGGAFQLEIPETDEIDQVSTLADPVGTLEVPVENAGAVKFELADVSQGKTLVSCGVFIVEGASEVPSLFFDPEQVVWLYRHMTDGGVAPESEDYSDIRLVWVPPAVADPSAEPNTPEIEVSGTPTWTVEMRYRTG